VTISGVHQPATAVGVTPVKSPADFAAFIELPYGLYAGVQTWVPPLRRDVAHMLELSHPFYQHAQRELFLARDASGTVVGRIAAIKNDAHNQQHHDRVGFFGFFESVRDPVVARALFQAAAAWLAERGLNVMRGPVSPSINDEVGLLVDGFEWAPVVMMPYNPPYYAELIEQAGFVKAKDVIAYRHTSKEGLPERVVRMADALAKRHKITVRPLDVKQFDKEVDRVRMLYNTCWEANWGAVAMTDAEFADLAKQLKPVVVPELVAFGEIDGELAGFALALPDLNVALKRMGGRLLPFGWVKALWYGRDGAVPGLRVLTLGVLPQHRRTGVAELMYLAIIRNGLKRGMTYGESSWILEDNALMRQSIEKIGGVAYKTYRIYDKPIA
jgi:GNAT superfamily N-acetyltransferase